MKHICIFFVFIGTILSIDLDNNSLNTPEIQTYGDSKMDHSIINRSLLHDYINPDTYITGPGDIFLFNMVTSSRIVNLELVVSPLGTILIPIVGVVNVKNKNINYVYDIIIEKCKEKYVDANVYVELIRTRSFKVLVTGNFNQAGMFSVSSTNRISDLIESTSLSGSNYLVYEYLPDFPRKVFLNKKISLLRKDTIINIDLFDYYTKGDFSSNPTLLEGDVINVEDSNRITVIGAVEAPIRIEINDNMTYADVMKEIDIINFDETIIYLTNYKVFIEYPKNEINRISKIDSKYRSDTDDSFLNSRLKINYGVLTVDDKNDLSELLPLKPSAGDIVIVQKKVDYVEIIGGVIEPGLYKYNQFFDINNYIEQANGFNKEAKSKELYVINSTNGIRLKVDGNYSPNGGDIIFIEEKPTFKSWERFSETITLAGTLATMSLVMYNIWNTK